MSEIEIEIRERIRKDRMGYKDSVLTLQESHIVLNALQRLEAIETENAKLKARLERAVELPCKVGDSAYYIQKCKIYCGTVVCLCFSSSSVKEIGVELPSLNIDEYEYMPSSYCIEEKEIGKTLFFTKQAAEARLAELRGNI